MEAADDFWNSDGKYGAEEVEKIRKLREEKLKKNFIKKMLTPE